MPRGRLHHLLLPLAAAIAILPLLLHGPSCGHDFDFHILNWFEAAAQFRHGNLHPLWAVSPAWNAGEPRFLFYPPLSWTLGALLGFVMPWTWTTTVYTWLALTASGLAMHRLARAHAGPTASLLAATLYLVNPYMLFTAYERTAYAELLAAAWLPLLVHAILKPRPTIPGIALPLALLWLTNAPAAVMGTYTLALLTLLRLLRPLWFEPAPPAPPATISGGPSLARTALAGTALGLALAAFYIVPAATERPLVHIALALLPGMRIVDNTLFHHTGTGPDDLVHDAVLRSVSFLAVMLLAVTLTALLNAARSRLARPLAVVTLILACFLTPLSLPLWQLLPELAFLQFPWRLCAVLACVFGLAAALALGGLRLQPLPTAALTLTLAATLALPAAHRFGQSCDDPDTIPARLALYQSNAGTEPTDEYTPTPADNDVLKPGAPPFWLSPNPDAPPPPHTNPATSPDTSPATSPATSPDTNPGPAPRDLDLVSPLAQHLILNLRAYPGWLIQLDGHMVPAANPRTDGLVTLPIPAGHSHLHLEFRESPAEHLAALLSLFALLSLLVLLARGT